MIEDEIVEFVCKALDGGEEEHSPSRSCIGEEASV